MQFPTQIYWKRHARYKADFITLSQKELDDIGSKYLNSQFLRIWSGVGYSNGRFWHIAEVSEETTEIVEIVDIDLYMKELYSEWSWVFDAVSKNPELLKEFQERFKN